MKDSLQVFLDGIIDYAGLFPPAGLPLDQALDNFAKYRSGPDSRMLSRFIIPASMLEQLSPYGEEYFTEDNPFPFSVLGKATEMIDEFKDEIEEVLASCRSFHKIHGGTVTTNLLEIKLPKEAAFFHDEDALQDLMEQTAEKLRAEQETPNRIFYEGILDQSWKKDISSIIESVAKHNQSKNKTTDNYQFAGFKLRCGGVEAPQFPSAGQVAFILNKVRDHEIPMKCTAGLHHPVRHYRESVHTKMHGFINVFGGAMLSYANNLTNQQLEEIICEEDAEQFTFSDEAFGWNDYAIATEEIKQLRESALRSYGSCSFEEPREDLQALKLW